VAAHLEEQARTRPRKLAETTRDKIAEALRQGALAGEGPEKVAARVRDAIAGEASMGRARVIARTEIGAAQNAALVATAEERGGNYVLEWVAVEDARTRPTHAAADGQRRAPGEMFTVGEARLRWPCDPEGPPGEIINCRCTLLVRRLSAPEIGGASMQR
jgi:SPP1 gp7 family putative phage head morphogenesis protein